jgi:hypothetical protein
VRAADLSPDVEGIDLIGQVEEILEGYGSTLSGERRRLLRRYRLVDMARKVVGVGSVGTRAWILLLVGRDEADPLFLQMKEAESSVLEGFAGPPEYDSQGERVVSGQRLMQAAGDIFLGWQRVRRTNEPHRDYYIRQLQDWKGSPQVEVMLPAGCAPTRNCAHGPSPGPTPAPATPAPSPVTWGRGMRSTVRSPPTPRPTRIATRRTTSAWSRRRGDRRTMSRHVSGVLPRQALLGCYPRWS